MELVADTTKPTALSGVACVSDSFGGKIAGPSRKGSKTEAFKGNNVPPQKDEEVSTRNIRSVPNRRYTTNRKSGPSMFRDTDKRQRSSSLPPKRQNLPIISGLEDPQRTDIVIV